MVDHDDLYEADARRARETFRAKNQDAIRLVELVRDKPLSELPKITMNDILILSQLIPAVEASSWNFRVCDAKIKEMLARFESKE